jgi:hypothetical protein
MSQKRCLVTPTADEEKVLRDIINKGKHGAPVNGTRNARWYAWTSVRSSYRGDKGSLTGKAGAA